LTMLRKIRQDSRYATIPVVMLTSSAEAEAVAEGLAAGAQLYLTKPAPRKLLRAAMAQIESTLDEKRALAANLAESRNGLKHAKHMEFEIKTIDQGRELAAFLASMTNDPERTSVGFHELLINAIEHGNLEISYALKSELLQNETLSQEIARRLATPPYSERKVDIMVDSTDSELIIHITDEGEGFDWKPFMDFSPERAFDLHGRGIAISNKMAFDTLKYLGKGNCVRVSLYKKELPATSLDNQEKESGKTASADDANQASPLHSRALTACIQSLTQRFEPARPA
ncbi:MAG: ATP-binding protein, partial [Limnobacter sp.]|nr:ATP-binding protein [Limnobacter sp.]